MTFAPTDRSGSGMNLAVRNILFWVLFILLAVVLWQMASKKTAPNQGTELSYSDFMNQVDSKNIQTATLTVMQTTADVVGRLKEPSIGYRTTVPRDTLSALLDKLRQQGAAVQVSEGTQSRWVNWALVAAPIVFLIWLWIFMMGRLRARQNPSPPNQGSPGAIS